MISDIAIDFGESELRIYVPGKPVFCEPSVLAINKENDKVVAIGREALKMIGRVGNKTAFIRPFSSGVVNDLSFGEYMLTSFLKKRNLDKSFLPCVTVAVPQNMTEVEKDAMENLLEKCGIRKFKLQDNLKAAAKSCGVKFKNEKASMIVKLGYKSGFCGVLQDTKTIAINKITFGGQDFDNALISYVRKNRMFEIGTQTADFVKKEIGCVFPMSKMISCHMKGKDIVSSLPKDLVITSDEIMEAYLPVAVSIVKEISMCIAQLSEENFKDIQNSGIVLCGGTSLIYGMDKYFEKMLKVPVKIAEKPEEAVVKGLLLK